MHDIQAEAEINEGKGRIVKVRLEDRPVPNVTWYWLPLGNCRTCESSIPRYADPTNPRCTDRRVTRQDYAMYMETNTCPFFDPGIAKPCQDHNDYDHILLDVMKAAGIVHGEPSERIKVLQNVPWSRSNSLQAHAQQDQFFDKADEADSGNDHDVLPGEDDDWADDLGDIDSSDAEGVLEPVTA